MTVVHWIESILIFGALMLCMATVDYRDLARTQWADAHEQDYLFLKAWKKAHEDDRKCTSVFIIVPMHPQGCPPCPPIVVPFPVPMVPRKNGRVA
jgi:hypothetical protein